MSNSLLNREQTPIDASKIQFHNSVETTSAIAHLCNMRRDIKTQMSRIGGTLSFHTWEAVGPDHYADAVLYAMIAADVVTARGRLDFIEINGNAGTERVSIYQLQNRDVFVPSIWFCVCISGLDLSLLSVFLSLPFPPWDPAISPLFPLAFLPTSFSF